MSFYCYRITNLITEKIYIGKAVDVTKRWSQHKTAAKRQDSNDFSILHRAMLKYGFDQFIIEQLSKHETEAEALAQETLFIEQYQSRNRDIGYNITEGGEGSSGYVHTDAAKRRMSEIKKMAYVGEGNPFYGKTHSIDTRTLISEFASTRTSENNPFYGKKHSEESLQKIKQNHFDKPKRFSEDDIAYMRYQKKVLKMTYLEIAKECGVHWKTIANAVHGRRAYAALQRLSL